MPNSRNGERTLVWVVDDDPDVLDSLSALLQAGGLSVRAFPSAESLLASWERSPAERPAAILADVRLPGTDGIELLHALRKAGGTVPPTVYLTGHADVPLAVRAMRAGAADFLEKPIQRAELMATLFQALAREGQQDPGRQRGEFAALQEKFLALTPRERDVLKRLLVRGSNKGVAADLGMSVRTVETHRSKIFEKTGARSLPELVRLALAAGFDS